MPTDSALENTVPLRTRLMQSNSINVWTILLTPALCFIMANLLPDLAIGDWQKTETLVMATVVALLFAMPAHLLHTCIFDSIAALHECGLKEVKDALWLDGAITFAIAGFITLCSFKNILFGPPMLMLLVALPLGQLFRYGWLSSLTYNETQGLDRFIIWSYRIAKAIPVVFVGGFILIGIVGELFR